MFFYDSQAGGGSGIVEVVAEKFGVLLEKAQQIISGCGCSEGPIVHSVISLRKAE